MTDQTLSATAAILLSLMFTYIPTLADRYNTYNATHKRLIMLACLVTITAAISALSCLSVGAYFGVTVTCDKSGIAGLVNTFILAVVANQGTFLISPKT